MVEKKVRVPVPPELATEVLFRSDLTCCVCHVPNRHVQTHHINDDPSDNQFENLAVLCLEDHARTQISGGFGRKLTADIVTRYRDDWLKTVEMKRDAEALRYMNEMYSGPQQQARSRFGGLTHASPAQLSNIGEPRNEDTSKSGAAKQLLRLADELIRQEKLTRQIAAATNVLADITTEFNGALSSLVLKIKMARSASEASKARDELAEELIPIATRYSTQAYSIRSIDNERVRGLEAQLEIFMQIPRADWPEVMPRSVQEKKHTVKSRLNNLNDTQAFCSNISILKGKSPRLDNVLQHMLDAMTQELSVRSSYENLQHKLDALDA